MTYYILRFDDFTRFSDLGRWDAIHQKLKEKGIRGLIGVTPSCHDERLIKNKSMPDSEFWSKIKGYKNFDIGMHGLHHENFGLMGQEQQMSWMMESMKLFVKHCLIPDVFIPPNHSLNKYTVHAMRLVGMTHLSEGIGLWPWKDVDSNIIVVPQILWTPRKVPLGLITFCLHPDTMSNNQITHLFNFIDENSDDIVSIFDVETPVLGVINAIFAPFYLFLYKRKKGLKVGSKVWPVGWPMR